MPLYWTIDSKARLFTGVAEGDVTISDAIDLLEAMEGAKAMSYRKLFDGRDAVPSMSPDECCRFVPGSAPTMSRA